VLVDNQKTEVISHRIGVAVEFNPGFYFGDPTGQADQDSVGVDNMS